MDDIDKIVDDINKSIDDAGGKKKKDHVSLDDLAILHSRNYESMFYKYILKNLKDEKLLSLGLRRKADSFKCEFCNNEFEVTYYMVDPHALGRKALSEDPECFGRIGYPSDPIFDEIYMPSIPRNRLNCVFCGNILVIQGIPVEVNMKSEFLLDKWLKDKGFEI